MKSLNSGMELIRCAETGEGYPFGDVVFHPITVRDYAIFTTCSSASTLRLSMLPAAYAVMNYAQAIFAMAINEDLPEEERTYFTKFMHLFALSLGSSVDDIQIYTDAKDITKLAAIVVKQTTAESEELVRFDTRQLGQIREIIAALNGRELPDESENAELVEAEQDIKSSGVNTSLKADVEDLKASVAAYYKVRLRELDDWTVFEFEKARSAIERMTRCVICGIGEAGGMVKYEKGNPFPSLIFDRIPENPALINVNDFMRRVGGAVEMSDGLPGDLPMGIN